MFSRLAVHTAMHSLLMLIPLHAASPALTEKLLVSSQVVFPTATSSVAWQISIFITSALHKRFTQISTVTSYCCFC